MQIQRVVNLHGPQNVIGPHAVQSGQPIQLYQPPGPVDEVVISQEAQLLDRVREMPDMRMDRVTELRAAIAEGVYETDLRLDVAVTRLLDELA